MPSTAFCQSSWSPTSATERLNLSRSRSFRLNSTWRLAFREALPGMNSSTVQSPTIITAATGGGRNRARGSELGRDLVQDEHFEDVPRLQVAEVLDADPALVALLDFPDVVLEPA